jgi:UDP-2,4-diacetamido-2,4,6-trideoxy-beta-L-altropyranose hydrolase
MQNIAIRVDESGTIGSGHISRCIALAQIIRDEYPSINFYSKVISSKSSFIIKQCGFGQFNIDSEDDFLEKINQDSIVILDGYHFDSKNQLAIKNTLSKLICIDDRVKKIHYHCDALINYGIAYSDIDFKKDSNTKLYLGSRYFLLRNAFRVESMMPLKSKRKSNLFISFGGSDKYRLTEKIITSLDINQFDEINIVIGNSKSKARLMSLISNMKTKIKIHKNIEDFEMLCLMKNSKFAIVPASTLMLEFFTVGCNLVTGWFAENQKVSLKKFEELKLIHNIGRFRVNKIKKIQFNLAAIPRKNILRKQKEFIKHAPSDFIKILKSL